VLKGQSRIRGLDKSITATFEGNRGRTHTVVAGHVAPDVPETTVYVVLSADAVHYRPKNTQKEIEISIKHNDTSNGSQRSINI